MGLKKKEMSAGMKIFTIIITAASISYAGVNLGLIVSAYNSFEDTVTASADLVENWQHTTITDLEVVTGDCSSGFTNLYSETWGGVNDGCYCGAVSSTVKQQQNITCDNFCTGSCSSTFLNAGCVDVAGEAAQPLNYWGSISSTPAKICAQRTTETWAEIASLVNEDGSCPDGYTACGSTPELTFCTEESVCPINSLRVEGTGYTCSTDCAILDDTSGSEKYLVWTRADTVDALPISNARINEHGMCIDENEDNETPNRPSFYLERSPKSSCGDVSAARSWSELDSLNEEELFDLNDINTYLATLTGYDDGYYTSSTLDGTDYTWKLFSREYIPWNFDCRDLMERVVDSAPDYDSLLTAQTVLLVIVIISTIALGIILPALLIMNLCGYDLPCFAGEGEDERKRINKFKRGWNYCFKGLELPFKIWVIILAARNRRLYQDLKTMECSTDIVNEDLGSLSATLDSAFTNNIIAIAILVVTIIVDIILSIVQDRKARKVAQQEQLTNRNNETNAGLQQQPVQQQPVTYQDPNQGFTPNQGFNPGFQQGGAPQGQNIVIQIQNPGMQQQPGFQQNTQGNPFAR